MSDLSAGKDIIEAGVKAADSKICDEDKIWSRYSHDKVDIGEELARVIRTLNKELPLEQKTRALSVGSSAEPQFRILEADFRGGLYLLDIDEVALGIVKDRIKRQKTDHVFPLRMDYNKIFLSAQDTENFLKNELGGRRVELVTLHHSLYYSKAADWDRIFDNIYSKILSPTGAIHAVLMASKSEDKGATTWLYNHFAGKFCGCRNDQDLLDLGDRLGRNPIFKNSQILSKTHKVDFYVDDFSKFMSVVWMILLYPDVHKYTLPQKQEISEFIYNNLWSKKNPLIQLQDHLVIYKGLGFRGLI